MQRETRLPLAHAMHPGNGPAHVFPGHRRCSCVLGPTARLILAWGEAPGTDSVSVGVGHRSTSSALDHGGVGTGTGTGLRRRPATAPPARSACGWDSRPCCPTVLRAGKGQPNRGAPRLGLTTDYTGVVPVWPGRRRSPAKSMWDLACLPDGLREGLCYMSDNATSGLLEGERLASRLRTRLPSSLRSGRW